MNTTFNDIRVIVEKGLENFKLIENLKIESQGLQQVLSTRTPSALSQANECHLWVSGVARIDIEKISNNAIVHSMADMFYNAVHKEAASIVGFSADILVNLEENYIQVGFSISSTSTNIREIAKKLTNEIVEQTILS